MLSATSLLSLSPGNKARVCKWPPVAVDRVQPESHNQTMPPGGDWNPLVGSGFIWKQYEWMMKLE